MYLSMNFSWQARILWGENGDRRDACPTYLETRSASRSTSVHNRQIHVAGVVEDAAAIDAGDQFVLGLAGDEDLRGQFHMATAADAVLDAHDHIAAFVFEEPIVTRARSVIHGGGEFFAVGGELFEFFFEILLA